MAFRKWFWLLFVGGAAVLAQAGCSSSTTETGGGDGGSDAAIHKMLEASVSGDDGGGSFDMTTGKVCASNTDCTGVNGPGFNVCSSTIAYTVAGQTVSLWPTPICLLPPPAQGDTFGNCDPAPTGAPAGYPHFCDGPDDPSSPGLCLPLDTTPMPNRGICLPKCTFGTGPTAQVGCPGADACVNSTYLQDPTTLAVTGYGFCEGVCQTDADCGPLSTALGTTFVCQTDVGYCAQSKVTRPKAVGDTCNVSADGTTDDLNSGKCNCTYDTMSTTGPGFCTTACVTGGLPCPTGYLCDADFSSPLDFGTATPVPITGQPLGMAGICRPTCTLPADAGAPDGGPAPTLPDAGADADVANGGDAGALPALDGGTGGCPSTTTCQDLTLVGPGCFPN
jgi:hypothetical protein